ncbi:EAL domain-containing protein [uncultured Fibrobacter sp.]|uniref:EAL domain-containing protein n=1 Tax=uncultured Fibrobacter sp. TaxID=261512 RepID=UPI00345BF7CC
MLRAGADHLVVISLHLSVEEIDFEEAFEKGHFKVYNQPVVRALTGKVCGYEALARWIDPERGMISPVIFIEVLEKVLLIHRLDAYTIITDA